MKTIDLSNVLLQQTSSHRAVLIKELNGLLKTSFTESNLRCGIQNLQALVCLVAEAKRQDLMIDLPPVPTVQKSRPFCGTRSVKQYTRHDSAMLFNEVFKHFESFDGQAAGISSTLTPEETTTILVAFEG